MINHKYTFEELAEIIKKQSGTFRKTNKPTLNRGSLTNHFLEKTFTPWFKIAEPSKAQIRINREIVQLNFYVVESANVSD
ncbi:hypothetical protein BSK54_21110 [Paenibacillus odorifer]|nr:hypothetical protein BSK54_21110 [Paenibacillus odorifer]